MVKTTAISTKARRRIRRSLILRDGLICAYCGEGMEPLVERNHPLGMTIDHIKPRALGGSNKLENLRLLHRQCNCDLGASMYEEIEALKEYDTYKQHLEHEGDF